jgi:hypothetical protein
MKSFAFLFVVFIFGCSKSAPPKEVLDELTQKQHKEHVGIGWVDGQKLELIVFGAKPNVRDYTLSAEDMPTWRKCWFRRTTSTVLAEPTMSASRVMSLLP